jgi:hypothetical protein
MVLIVNYSQAYTHMLITPFSFEIPGLLRPVPQSYQLRPLLRPRLARLLRLDTFVIVFTKQIIRAS